MSSGASLALYLRRCNDDANQGGQSLITKGGEYELYAVQNLPTGEWLRSPPQKISVRGGDVTELSLTLTPLGSIEGRFVFENDPKAPCGKRRETAAPESIVRAWRSAPEKTNAPAKADSVDALPSSNFAGIGGGDEKGSFTLRNLQPGNYLIDSQPPASGWYLKSVVIGTILYRRPLTSGQGQRPREVNSARLKFPNCDFPEGRRCEKRNLL